MALRQAEDSDWAAMFGMQPPADWFGFVESSGWLVEGIGAVYRDTLGRWWLTFQRIPAVGKVKTAHKSAKVLLAVARERGLEVRTIPDLRIEGAELWIERLGFQKTDEQIEGQTVWLIQ